MIKFVGKYLAFGVFSLSTLLHIPTADARDAASQAALYNGGQSFDVLRKGKKIGNYSTRFSVNGDKVSVQATMTLRVKILGITAYRYRYTSNETWQKNTLIKLTSRVDDNGKKTRVDGVIKQNKFSWTGSRRNGSVAPPIFTTNHWHNEVLQNTKVFNTIIGRVDKVKVRKVGTDKFQCNGRTLSADRYKYSGQLRAESWYDRSGRWVGPALYFQA